MGAGKVVAAGIHRKLPLPGRHYRAGTRSSLPINCASRAPIMGARLRANVAVRWLSSAYTTMLSRIGSQVAGSQMRSLKSTRDTCSRPLAARCSALNTLRSTAT